MNFDLIETFLKIVDNNSFTKTANELYCSQAAISLRVKKLEESINHKLFVRNNNTFELSKEGEVFVPYARKLLRTMESANAALTSLQISDQNLDVTSSNTPGTYMLPRVFFKFQERYQKVNIVNHVQYRKSVIKDLEKNIYKIGFISTPSISNNSSLVYHKIADDPVCIVVSPTHPLALTTDLDPSELLNHKIFVSNPDSKAVAMIENIANIKIPISKVHVSGHLEAIKKDILENGGYALLSECAVETELKYGMLKKLDINNLPHRVLYLVHKTDYTLTNAESILVEFAKESLVKKQV